MPRRWGDELNFRIPLLVEGFAVLIRRKLEVIAGDVLPDELGGEGLRLEIRESGEAARRIVDESLEKSNKSLIA